MTENQLEQEALGWLADVGWQHRHGPDMAPGRGSSRARDLLASSAGRRLRQAVAALNPEVPAGARDDAIRQVLNLGTPVLAANRQFHRLRVTGGPVQYPSMAD